MLAVHLPAVGRLRPQRGTHEAAALGSLEQGGELVARRRRFELCLHAALDLEEAPASILAPADGANRVGARLELEPPAARVVGEARQGAARKRGQHQVLGGPGLLERQGLTLGAENALAVERHLELGALRLGAHAPNRILGRRVTERPLAVLGATGYTGQLVCRQARDLGLPLRLVGRRPEALQELAEAGEEVQVADARDREALVRAFSGCFAVISCAGPFLALGTAPVEAALEARVHYLDSSGEQPFARIVYERFDGAARERGVVLLTSFGFDFVPGDLAARLAAEDREPLESIVVAYDTSGLATSRGTRQTLGHVLAQEQVAYEGGTLVTSSFGATTRRVRFPEGEKSVIEWGGTEPLTVPRHTDVRTVRSYVQLPKLAARVGALGRLAAPVVRRLGRLGPAGPGEERRRKSRFTVLAEARGGGRGRRVTLRGSDVYGLTALTLVRGVEALRDGEARAAGSLAPAEAFDARAFLQRLSPLVEIHSEEDL